MANPEHVAIVRQGPGPIAAWRDDNPDRQLDLSGANLESGDLSEANLYAADLSGADLSRTRLSGANLRSAILIQADLSWAKLYAANLSGADLRRADFRGCICAWTVFSDVDLSEVMGLDSVEHVGPSTVGIDTLFKSRGKIAEAFLRGAGVPEILITYLASLTGKALEFYTCFISFTEVDDALSRRLHTDLQAAGVRCWRWKEDAKWGRTLMGEVDSAIRVYDKLVVILSESSLRSEAVIREIERALQKELREGTEVLFPIRVDDAVFSWQHALQADVVRKVIGDFREWQDPAKYGAARMRLITDLRAAPKVV